LTLSGRYFDDRNSCNFSKEEKGSKQATYAIFLVAVDKDLSSSLSRHVRRDLFEFARRALTLDLQRIRSDLVLKHTARVRPPAQHKLGIRLLRLNNSFLDVIVNRRLNSAHEARAHVDSLSTQAQSSSETLAISEPAAGDERHRHSLASAREENEVRNIALANVAGAFEAVDREEIHTKLHSAQRMPNRRALVQNHTRRVSLFQLLDDRARAVASSFDNADALVQDDLGVRGVVRGHHGGEQGEIDTERVFGHLLAAADFFAKILRRGLG
jgi:hypothetical protein